MTLTYLDSGVLIAAARRADAVGDAAIATLNDPNRTFASSEFVKLEVVPKAIYLRQATEVRLYLAFFASVSHWPAPLEDVVARALAEAERYGLAGMDALHVASALMTNADELITTGRPTAPIHRVTGIKVVSIHRSALTSR